MRILFLVLALAGLAAMVPSAAAAPSCSLGTAYVIDCGTGPQPLGTGFGFTIGYDCANVRADGPVVPFVLVGSESCPQSPGNRLGCTLGDTYIVDCGTAPLAAGPFRNLGAGLTMGHDCANVRSSLPFFGYLLLGDPYCPS